MTIDPKYAELPWIANDGKDFYESEDLPEVDQNILKQEENSIDTINISLEDARKKFKGSYVNADDVDFSDKIRPFVNTGYVIEKDEYISYPKSEQNNETILDRFQRIQHEVRDFVYDIELIKSFSVDNIESSKNKELLLVGKKLDSLANTFVSYKTHCSLGAEDAINVDIDEELCGFETKELFEDVQKYVARHKKDDSNTDLLSWEKYYKSPLTKELNEAKIASIDQRIQRIEAALGCGERCSTLSNLSSETATKSVLEAVRVLTSRCQPLKGGPNVDKIEARLVGLQLKLQAITDKRDLVTEADRQNKIAELFELVEKWHQFQLVLPALVRRLEDLHELHNQAMLFSDSMSFMDSTDKEVRRDIAQYSPLIDKLEKVLMDNVIRIRSNIDAIQSRVDGI